MFQYYLKTLGVLQAYFLIIACVLVNAKFVNEENLNNGFEQHGNESEIGVEETNSGIKNEPRLKEVNLKKGTDTPHKVYNAVPWPNGIIPFEISAEPKFPKEEIQDIFKAICMIEKSTCIRFVPKNKMKKKPKHSIIFLSTGLLGPCASPVGMVSNGPQPQQVRLQTKKQNVTCFHGAWSVAHELLHTLGFYHEQQRSNRDAYITINRDKIIPLPGVYELNFAIVTGNLANYAIKNSYDLFSLVHYPKSEAALVPGDITIQTKDQKYTDIIGTRKRLSKMDIRRLNAFYNCSMVKPRVSKC